MGDSERLTVVAGVAARLAEVGVRNGLDRQAILEEAGISPALLEDRENRVPLEGAIRLWHVLIARLPGKVLALEWLAAFKPPGDLGVLGYVLAQAENLGAALQALGRYGRLLNQAMVSSLERSSEAARVTFSLPPALLATQHQPETALVTLTTFVRATAESSFVPVAVHLPHPRTERTPELEEFFGTRVEHDRPRVALDLPVALLERPLAGADPGLAGYLRQQADQMLARMDVTKAVSLETTRRLAERLRAGEPAQADVARQMGMSERTLQRRLQGEGTSFNQLLEETRREFAVGYLADRKLAAYEVSFLLGYAEPATFFRAFKRWTGQTPQQYRASAG
jgi:AraC-like DNA-binding protein